MRVRLAVRDWDHLTPLLLGDVRAEGVDLVLDRVEDLPADPAADPRYDGAEMSLSRYALARARGDDRVTGRPLFLMRGFRHRCIIVRRDSPLTTVADLRGRTVGLGGWPDSGNTWTRAILRHEGVGIDEVRWRVGRLSFDEAPGDRLGPFGRPGSIERLADDEAVLPMLADGRIDAAFVPFMPAGFHDADAPFRQLIPDYRAAEADYAAAVGYVPGMHLLGFRAEFAAAHPAAVAAVEAALTASRTLWAEKRLRYADTTPWLLDELRQVARDLPPDWAADGYAANERMLADFCAEQVAQGLTANGATPRLLFPADADGPR